MPSWDFSLGPPAPVATTIQIESEPAGAEARTSVGPSCRTPCSLAVPTNDEFTVTFALNGFLPQVVPVRPRTPVDPRDIGPAVQFEPNPVYAQLEPAPPPPRGKKKGPKKPASAARQPPPG